MNGFLFPPTHKIHTASFRRTPESSFIKALDTGLRTQGAGRGYPRNEEAVVVEPMNRQQPRTKAAKAATTTLRRCDEFLETPFHPSFKEPHHVAQPS